MLNLAVKILSRFPFWILFIIAELFAWFSYHVFRYRRDVVFRNLKKSFPGKSEQDIRKVAIRFYRHFFQVWCEVLKGRNFTQDEWRERVTTSGFDLMKQHLDAGTSIIFMTGHAANWEWAGAATQAWIADHPVTVFYKAIKNEEFGREILDIRKRAKLNPIEKDTALRYLIKTKNIPQLIGMISDQIPALGAEKYWMNFLGQDTAFYQGAEKFSKSMKYPVFYADMRKVKRGHYHIEVIPLYDGREEIDEGQVILSYAKLLEETIKSRPSDYLWSHRRWKYSIAQSKEATDRIQKIIT